MKRLQALAASESYAKLFEKIVIAKKKFKKWKKNMNGFVVFFAIYSFSSSEVEKG